MKLARIRKNGKITPAIVQPNGSLVDCSSLASDWDGPFYESSKLEALAKDPQSQLASLPAIEAQPHEYAPSIPRPGKIICIGLNFSDHAKEAGLEIPTEPIIFMKATSALSGPYDPILKPRNSDALDWEVELGIVIGKRTRYLKSPDEAASCIAGYTIVHDVSERDFQFKHEGQWTKGKSHDTFCPVGPWVVTSDELPDPSNLKMTLTVNGEIKQDGNTSTMVFSSAQIVEHLSQFMTLEAGDIVTTGTPPGVGAGMKPPQFLQLGDEVTLSIEKLGTQTQTIIADE